MYSPLFSVVLLVPLSLKTRMGELYCCLSVSLWACGSLFTFYDIIESAFCGHVFPLLFVFVLSRLNNFFANIFLVSFDVYAFFIYFFLFSFILLWRLS